MTTGPVKFEVQEKGIRLLIEAESNLYDLALASLLKHSADLENYITLEPQFGKSFTSVPLRQKAPLIAKTMAAAAKICKVGPMATMAGALAELVGRELLPQSAELIIEAGGNYFLKISRLHKIPIHPKNVALEVEPRPTPFSVCVSTGLENSVYSFSKADAVVAIATDAALANAAAIAIGNTIKEASDIEQGLRTARKIKGVSGALIMKGDQLGVLGKIKIVPL